MKCVVPGCARAPGARPSTVFAFPRGRGKREKWIKILVKLIGSRCSCLWGRGVWKVWVCASATFQSASWRGMCRVGSLGSVTMSRLFWCWRNKVHGLLPTPMSLTFRMFFWRKHTVRWVLLVRQKLKPEHPPAFQTRKTSESKDDISKPKTEATMDYYDGDTSMKENHDQFWWRLEGCGTWAFDAQMLHLHEKPAESEDNEQRKKRLKRIRRPHRAWRRR